MSVFANTGQDCCARSRIYVQRPAFDDFVKLFTVAIQFGAILAVLILYAARVGEMVLGVVGKNNIEASAKVGAAIAERAKKAGVDLSSRASIDAADRRYAAAQAKEFAAR